MADLASTRVFGKLTVMHEAVVKANAEIVGDITASKFIGDGSQLTDLPWGELTGAPATATRWPAWGEVTGKPSTFAPSAHTHSLSQITDAGDLASLSTNASTSNFLRGDGTWVTPPNANTVTSVRANNTGTYRTGNINLIGGSNVTVSEGTAGQFTITSTNTNTTYSAGSGLSLSGTTFSLPVTVSGSGSYVQSVTQSTNGLTVTLGTPPNTNTTYTEITTAEIDAGTASTLRTITGRRMKYALDKKADTSTQVIAGTGLSGGGTLAANRTLNVQYGTTAGTAAQGNDSRLSDSREWTATVVGQTEAEEGTATTARKWTAQRVRQAILGWWNGSTDKTKLDGIATGATANATDAQLRARSSHTGTQAISTITGLDTALNGKVDTSDARLSDSRDWSATVVTQAEAQAGTSTTARKWTAQRVAQAISALGLKIGTTSSTAKAGNWMPTWANVTGKPTTFTPESHTHSLSDVTDAGNLAALNTNASTANFLRGDGTWVTPPNTNTTYTEITTAEIDAGTASTLRTISGRRMKHALDKKSDTDHGHVIDDITGLQTAIDSKANTSTQVIAGTGLTGGGTLAADCTLSVGFGTVAGTVKEGDWQPSISTKTQVLNGDSSNYVTGSSYVDTISWNTTSHSSGTVTLNLNTSLNHILNISGNVTIGVPSNATLGKTGDIVLRVNSTNTSVVVGWNARWKFLGSVPDIGSHGEVWVVSYKVLSSTEILASAAKVA